MEFGRWLRKQYYRATKGGAPNAEAMTTAIATLDARAQFDGVEEEVFVRVARVGDRIYFDLSNEAGQVVEITAAGWQVLDQSPVRFLRSRTMLPVPTPVHGGSIDELKPFLTMKTAKDFQRVVGFLLSSLRGEGPHYVLIVLGEHGAAKSTTGKLLRLLIDPAIGLLLAPPKTEDDLYISASEVLLVGFDNLRTLSDTMSDSLCRLSTGAAFEKRKLYTDLDKISLSATKPIVLNGIRDVVSRPDLADRGVFFELEYVPATQRRDEKELYQAFEMRRPTILGALFDGLVEGLKQYDSVQLTELPRMADCMKWVTACETAYWGAGTYARVVAAATRDATLSILENDAFGSAIQYFMASLPEDYWEGTATKLLFALTQFTDEGARRHKEWPASNKIRGALRSVAGPLRDIGITFQHIRQGDTKNDKLIRLEKRASTSPQKYAKQSSEASGPSEERKYSSHNNSLDEDQFSDATNDQEPLSSEPSEVSSENGGVSSEKQGVPSEPSETKPLKSNGKSHSSDGSDRSDDCLSHFGEETRALFSSRDLIRDFALQHPKRSPAWLAKQLGQPETKVREALELPPKTVKPKAANGEAAP